MSDPLKVYQDEWTQDAAIDPSAIDEAARNIPMLHAKWYAYYSRERLKFKKLDLAYKKLYRYRYEYWHGKLDDAVRLAHGWDVQPLKILSPQIPVYMDADDVLSGKQLQLAYQTEVCQFLEATIKALNNRGYLLKTMVDFLKWKSGV